MSTASRCCSPAADTSATSEPMDPEPLVQIYRGGGGPPQSELLRSLLAGSDIDSVIAGSELGATYPVNLGALGEFTVYVKESDAEDAAALLRDALGE